MRLLNNALEVQSLTDLNARHAIPIALCLLFGAASSSACGPFGAALVNSICVGTGVSDPTASVSVDVGSLTEPSATASLRVGQVLFVGSNGCEDYELPPADSVSPVLSELSRHVYSAPRPDDVVALDATYKAVAPGTVTIPVACRGDSCPGSPILITVTVAPSP